MSDLCLPLTQSIEYERTCARLGIPVQRHDWTGGTCLIQSRKMPLIGMVNLISRGPVMVEESRRSAILQDLLSSVRGPLILNLETGTRPAGAWRFMEGLPLAIRTLDTPETMRSTLAQKWRNRLNKAERAGFTIIDQPLEASRHSWFLDAEAAQQKARRYRSHPTGFLLAYAKSNKGQARLLTALEGGTPLAGVLIFKHGRMATYQAGITTPEGRRKSAHHALIWKAMTELYARGFERLDLGRLDLGHGLAHFKRGTGAQEMTLSGTYLMHPRLSRRTIDNASSAPPPITLPATPAPATSPSQPHRNAA